MRKVAIIRRNGLGDLLLAYPLIFYLKKREPDTSITLFLDERNAPLFPYFPKIVDEMVVIPKKGNKYLTHIFTALKYRKEKFDLAISAKTSPMKLANVFLFSLGAAKRRAFVEKGNWSTLLINERKFFDPLKAVQTHQALKGLQLIEPDLQSIPEEFYPKLNIPEEIRKKYLPSLSLSPPYLVLSASSTSSTNRIDEKKYAELVNRLYERFSFSVLLIAQKPDEQRALAIKKELRVPNILHFPRNFDDFMVWLSLGDLFFVSDGGIAHIGAALGKQEVIFFGSASPIQWAPLSKKSTIFFHREHVNLIPEEKIFEALCQKCEEMSLWKKVFVK